MIKAKKLQFSPRNVHSLACEIDLATADVWMDKFLDQTKEQCSVVSDFEFGGLWGQDDAVVRKAAFILPTARNGEVKWWLRLCLGAE